MHGWVRCCCLASMKGISCRRRAKALIPDQVEHEEHYLLLHLEDLDCLVLLVAAAVVAVVVVVPGLVVQGLLQQ